MADLFDGIVMAEQRFHGEGYQEGLAEGSHAGMAEGRMYGAFHGARIGSEIGCYLGFALTWHCLLQKCTDEKNSKKIKALDSLIGMIQKFPYEDPTYDKLQEDLERIRGKFKQTLKIRGMSHQPYKRMHLIRGSEHLGGKSGTKEASGTSQGPIL
ncbi:protein LTO1 homolog isoform X1 [Oenanthe melanoleuca]|uniref:protein LTO1 homolog isoform X1 n=1 Tax=Oenanthe melanoleuca TaxID=2939378 RepID=UPI0024C16594|nr:protein LTO1 homolog isoform X1 [Oenanthe melanoleuca]